MKKCSSARVTTLIDNDVWKGGLASTWGLSFYVDMNIERRRHVILMDTGDSFEILSKNTSELGVDLSAVEVVFISHWHGDHCGCLSQVLPFLGQSTPIYVPSENPFEFRRIESAGGIPKACSKPIEFIDGVMSTGDLGGEHSLFVNVRDKGLVILTGCAHPGIINTVKRAQQVSGVSKVQAVIGGFHISPHKAVETANFLNKIGVELASPCHCTTENAKNAVANILGERFVRNGSGKTFAFK